MAKNVNSNPEDTRTGHFDTGFFGFLWLQKNEITPQF
jgi:hypothetical protein